MKRYPVLDYIRSLNFISMVLYHLCWDLVYLYGVGWRWYRSEGAYVWQQSICWIFILLSGFCWSMGRKKWRRGLLVSGGGIVISLVTCIFLPQERILFGVLTLLGASMLLLIPLEKGMKKVPAAAGLVLSLFAFFLFRNAGAGYLGFESLHICALPQKLYGNVVTAFFGFPEQGFFSTDYFPLIPWFFLFLSGYFLYRIFKEKKLFSYMEGKPAVPVLTFISRHSLLLYLLHQPVIYVVLLIFMH